MWTRVPPIRGVKWPEWKVHCCGLALTFSCPPVYCARGPAHKCHVCMMSALGSSWQDGSGRVRTGFFPELTDDLSCSGEKRCVASFCINV